jgi:hypothetical protein
LLITVSLKQQSKVSIKTFHTIFLLFFRFVSFASGAILAVLIILTIYDEDVLNVEHMLTTMTSLGVILGICRSLIPDEVRKKNFLFVFDK